MILNQLAIPESVDDWTLGFVESLVDADYYETDSFDFKEFLVNKREPKHSERIRKSACAFANSNGGFLVFGVADRESGKVGRDRLLGVDKGDLGRLFGDQVNVVEPTIYYIPQNPPITIPKKQGKIISVVHIPRSLRAPHTFKEKGRFAFYKRTNKGNEPMTFLEVDMAFATKSGVVSKLTLLHSELGRFTSLLNNALATPNKEGGFTYPSIGPDPTLLQVITSDLYPLIHKDKELLLHLTRLAMASRAVNNEIVQIPLRMIMVKKAFEEYNISVSPKIEIMKTEISEIFRILEHKYEVTTNPILELQRENPDLFV